VTLWTIIPVKPFAQAKSRLSPILSDKGRSVLAEWLFEHVLREALIFAAGRPVLVVSAEPHILDKAREFGAMGLTETDPHDLNCALAQAADHAGISGASALLTLASDLPFLDAEDLRALEQAGGLCAGFAIAPDHAGTGTNATLLPPDQRIPYRFGANSFRYHAESMAAAGHSPAVVTRAGIASDLDTPEDWATMRAQLERLLSSRLDAFDPELFHQKQELALRLKIL
jgi:2-phospho-L-lactate guanylyltransferase